MGSAILQFVSQETRHDGHDHGTWSDDEWNEWKDYADRVQVQIRFKSWLGAQDNDESWVLESDGAAWSKDWLSRQLVELAAADADNSCCGRGNYALDATDRKTEWGASGAVYEAVLTLSENLLAEATWVALGALAQRLASRLKSKSPDLPIVYTLTEEEACDSAVWAIVASRESSRDSLEIESVEFAPDGTAVVTVRDATSGIRYSVDVHSRSVSVRLSRVRKVTYPPGGEQLGPP